MGGGYYNLLYCTGSVCTSDHSVVAVLVCGVIRSRINKYDMVVDRTGRLIARVGYCGWVFIAWCTYSAMYIDEKMMGCFVFGGSRDRDALGCRSFCITVWYLVKTGDGARVAVRCSGGLWPNRIKALRKTLPLEKK